LRVPTQTLATDLVHQSLERVNKEIKCRPNVVGVFPNPAALLRLAGVILIEQHDEWKAGSRRSLSEASMSQLDTFNVALTVAAGTISGVTHFPKLTTT